MSLEHASIPVRLLRRFLLMLRIRRFLVRPSGTLIKLFRDMFTDLTIVMFAGAFSPSTLLTYEVKLL